MGMISIYSNDTNYLNIIFATIIASIIFIILVIISKICHYRSIDTNGVQFVPLKLSDYNPNINNKNYIVISL